MADYIDSFHNDKRFHSSLDAETNRIRTTTCPRAATNVSPAKKGGHIDWT
jgi:hypothetical protein